MKKGSIVKDLAKGAVAGAVATWVMGRVTSFLYEHEAAAARQREDETRGGATAYGRAADRAADLVHMDLSERERRQLGVAIHWALGIGAGAVYGVMRPRVRWVDGAQGLGFGTAFWLAVDEALVPLLGLTPGPGAFPWQTHARGFGGHLSFGLIADTTLDLLDRIV